MAVAIFSHVLWRWLMDRSFSHSVDVAIWVGNLVAPIPACLALMAVVLTARAPAGTAIGVGSSLAATIANLGAFHSLMGLQDYLGWLAWAVALGCCLLGADVLAWRLGVFTPASGALAGLLVAALETVVKLAMYGFGAVGLSLADLGAAFWVQEYAVPAVLLVVAGGLGGAVVQRRGVSQETAGRG